MWFQSKCCTACQSLLLAHWFQHLVRIGCRNQPPSPLSYHSVGGKLRFHLKTFCQLFVLSMDCMGYLWYPKKCWNPLMMVPLHMMCSGTSQNHVEHIVGGLHPGNVAYLLMSWRDDQFVAPHHSTAWLSGTLDSSPPPPSIGKVCPMPAVQQCLGYRLAASRYGCFRLYLSQKNL